MLEQAITLLSASLWITVGVVIATYAGMLLGFIKNLIIERRNQAVTGITAEYVSENPRKVRSIIAKVKNSRLGALQATIAEAVKFKEIKERNAAIDEWLAISEITKDKKAQGRALFSAAYLIQICDPKYKATDRNAINRVISLYNDSIEIDLDPIAFHNRGNAKCDLGQYEDAIADYDKAIKLKPDYTEASDSRNLAIQKLEQYKGSASPDTVKQRL